MVLEWGIGLAALALGHGDAWGMSLAYDAADNVLPLAQQMDSSTVVSNLLTPLLVCAGAFLGARLGSKVTVSREPRTWGRAPISQNGDSPTEPAVYGMGEFPRELERLNWGTLFLPGFWSLFYGIWRWWVVTMAVWVGSFFLGLGLRFVAGPNFGAPGWALAVVALVAVPWVFRLWLAANANRALWLHEARRLGREGEPNTVEAVVARQRTWAWVGGAIWLWGFGFSVWQAFRGPERAFGGNWGTAAALALAVVAILTALLIDRRQRAGSQAGSASA